MKGLALLGSTGSIGVNTLEVVESAPDRWKVEALACGKNVELCSKQALKHKPKLIATADEQTAQEIKKFFARALNDYKPEIMSGVEGLKAAATCDTADVILVGISGANGLLPAWEAVNAGKKVALANKEALVLAGDLILDEARRRGCKVVPVDSEHSAVFQLLNGVSEKEVKKIWLGASGGPFRKMSKAQLEEATPEQALSHPVWKMGKRITVDSATMMNKGLEIIEACRLFRVSEDKVGVFVHPEGVVHAMVELNDGVMLAHLARPDMKGPIAYALYYPERVPAVLESPDIFESAWSFEPADADKFPCLRLAREALRAGGTMPAVLNAADEIAVQAFLDKKISFTDIPRLVEETMQAHEVRKVGSPEDALEADAWARRFASKLIEAKGIRQ